MPAPRIELPANLVAQCEKPVITTEWVNGVERVTMRTLSNDVVDLMAALEKCGAKVEAIRLLQK